MKLESHEELAANTCKKTCESSNNGKRINFSYGNFHFWKRAQQLWDLRKLKTKLLQLLFSLFSSNAKNLTNENFI